MTNVLVLVGLVLAFVTLCLIAFCAVDEIRVRASDKYKAQLEYMIRKLKELEED